MNDISPLACVSPAAVLGDGIHIGPFAIIEEGAVLGDGCRIEGGAVIKTGTVLGERVHVHTAAVIGGLPQDYSFNPATRTGVKIGDGTILREGVTVSRATKPESSTIVGRGCMLMAQSHVAHDCVVGDEVVLANCVLLAGHVQVGDKSFLGGSAVFHQHVRIGAMTMCGGNASVGCDVPPFCMVVERNHLAGFNLVGLRRRGVPRASIAELKLAYRTVYSGKALNPVDNAKAALESGDFSSDEARAFLGFFTVAGKRPTFIRPRRSKSVSADE